MATMKQRINISVSKSTYEALVGFAKRGKEPVAAKAANLVKMALNEIYKGKKKFF